ncbi:MAG: transaldolase [Planctomycetes bacterium]|nr:transaldolase [Planctomycetota bacterium]
MSSTVKAQKIPKIPDAVKATVAQLALRGISLAGPGKAASFRVDPLWGALRELGTELWLDTGDMEKAQELWTAHFTALTTNNTLLSKEVKKGIYDSLIREAIEALRKLAPEMGRSDVVREIGLLLNARHGLRLVEKFGCRVSVELHTDLAHDFDGALETAHRLYSICPQYFIIKVPYTPTGLLAVRRLVLEGLPINFTLEFSARQNVLAARLAGPQFVNVFLGRLNAFVIDHQLGDGKNVGEKATLSSQRELLRLRSSEGVPTRQIAASLREAQQVVTLAGLDVHTMPTNVAEGFPRLGLKPRDITRQLDRPLPISLKPGLNEGDIGLNALWDVPSGLVEAARDLLRERLEHFTGNDLSGFLARRGLGDLFPNWTSAELAAIAQDGKIPSFERWKGALKDRSVGLDALFNAAGLLSFAADQKQLDDRIASFLG